MYFVPNDINRFVDITCSFAVKKRKKPIMMTANAYGLFTFLSRILTTAEWKANPIKIYVQNLPTIENVFSLSISS
jgi:hypothetical protein